ncbi:hypothetical protein XaC1_188 [Xanthomonas phage XaC1]|nr:hypothetical protein XaC1_188 [Xanthomonas phage XaC1]
MILTRQQMIDIAVIMQSSLDDRMEHLGRTICKQIVLLCDEYKACITVSEKLAVHDKIFEYLNTLEPYQMLASITMFMLDGVKFIDITSPKYQAFVSLFAPVLEEQSYIDSNRVSDIDYVNSLNNKYEF